jgi:hypothetical protein
LVSTVSNMMAGIMLLHAVLGCCVHHDHTGEYGTGPHFAQARLEIASHCREHGCKQGPCGSHRHDSDPCHQGRCVFVRPSQDDLDLTAVNFHLLGTSLTTCQADDPNASNAWGLGDATPIAPLAVRSHLAKLVLLI